MRQMPPGLHYDPGFITPRDRELIIDWLSTIKPIWELRYSNHHPPPAGKPQRRLLRPVYWLGNWQFACLGYYHPPKGILNRCVQAEPFPPVLARLVEKIHQISRRIFRGADMPPRWHLNTCLVNLYGARLEEGKRIDSARVGEHKDFEPGPVASISLGERAMFQFVKSRAIGTRDAVVFQQWLDDGSLQIFGGARWKQHLFHRVQRVDRRADARFPLAVEDFEARRINFTFRYVPTEHIVPFSRLPRDCAEDIRGYVEQIATGSAFFRSELEKIAKKPN